MKITINWTNWLAFFLVGMGCWACTSPAQQESTTGQEDIRTLSDTEMLAHSVYLTHHHLKIPVIAWTEQEASENGEKRFFFSVWDSTRLDFDKKTEIPLPPNAALHVEGMPKLAFKGSGEIMAVYEVKVKSTRNPYAGEIHFIVSKDNGETWSEPQTVHASKEPDKGRGFFDMMTLADGEIGVSWLGESQPGGRPVLFAKTNSQNQFTGETVVDSLACQCCRTALFADSAGRVSILYRDILYESIRDISVSSSVDGGATFESPVNFSGDNWNIQGCPHNGPDVVSNGNAIFATWFTGAEESGVYFASLDQENLKADKRRISKNGKNIQVALHGTQPVMAYTEHHSEDGTNYTPVKLRIFPEMNEIDVSASKTKAHSPTLIADQKGRLIIAWISSQGEKEILKYKVMD